MRSLLLYKTVFFEGNSCPSTPPFEASFCFALNVPRSSLAGNVVPNMAELIAPQWLSFKAFLNFLLLFRCATMAVETNFCGSIFETKIGESQRLTGSIKSYPLFANMK